MKRTLLVILCLITVLSAPLAMVSCGSETEGQPAATTTPKPTLAEGETQDPEANLYDHFTPKDFEDEPFRILNSDSDWGLVVMDTEVISTPVDSAIYSRNQYLEENLCVDIEVTQMEYHAVNDTIYNQVTGDLYQYDICYNESWKQTALVTKGVYKSAQSYDQYLDFGKPWWYADVLSDLTIADNLYLVAGDMNMMLNDSLWCMAFNVDIINKFGETSPYELVYDGEWTYEALYRLSKDTRVDGKYGIVSHIAFADALIVGANLPLTYKNEDGKLVRSEIDDHFVTVFQKMVTYFFENNEMGGENGIRTSYESDNYTGGKFNKEVYNHHNEFTAGNATFHAGTVGDMRVYMPSSEIEYGIIPIPKYNTAQEDYISYVYRAASVCGVPANINNQSSGTLERVCTVMEWMCAYSYKLVKPVYYEVILYGRISRQPEAVDMLKIIFGLTEDGLKRVELDTVLTLGMMNAIELFASDCKMGISTKIHTISELVKELLDTTHDYYAEHLPIN